MNDGKKETCLCAYVMWDGKKSKKSLFQNRKQQENQFETQQAQHHDQHNIDFNRKWK